MKQYSLWLLAVMTCMAIPSPHTNAKTMTNHSGYCKEWQAKVDPAVPGKTAVDVGQLRDQEIVVAIECLMRNQGKQQLARISGATHAEVSQTLPAATIELASLYYISYLFTGNYQHGDGIALWDSAGAINPPGSTNTAYAAYEAWFARVKSLGISTARRQRLDPLQGTNIRWYGK